MKLKETTIMETNLLWQPIIMKAHTIVDSSIMEPIIVAPAIMETHYYGNHYCESLNCGLKYYGNQKKSFGKPLPKLVDGPKWSIFKLANG